MKRFRSKLTDFWRLGTAPWRTWNLRRQVLQGTVPVFSLFYHRVADCNPNPWSIPFADFRDHLLWMRERFDFVSMEECQRRIRHGNSRPAVAITFDDGYAENCEQAIPFLLEEKIPVTYFVTTEHTTQQKPFPHDVERGEPLAVNSIESIKSMANAGIEIGAHTRTHPDLGKVTQPQDLFDEIVVATRELEQAIGRSIRYFAFPFGQYINLNNDAFQLARQFGFQGICSAYGGWNDVGEESFHIQRIHGDPNFGRMKNWLGYDPRISKVQRHDWSQSTIDWSSWLDNEPAKPSQETPSNTAPAKVR